MRYPEAVEINGKEYLINTGYEYGLACFKALNDLEISESERACAIIGLLYKEWPDDENEALRLAVKYLQCGKESTRPEMKPDMDFEYDENLIESSFMSDYRIDLDEADMHWWKFNSLLQGLTDDSILNRVRDLRNYDVSNLDAKARQKVMKAKQDVALPDRMDREEQNIIDEFEAALNGN